MPGNPYEAPPAIQPDVGTIASGPYRPATAFVLALTLLFLTGAALAIATGVVRWLLIVNQFVVDDKNYRQAQDLLLPAATALVWISLAVWLATIALFSMWVYRAARNARALGALTMCYPAGWAVGSFFVPIANLFVPYQALQEVYRASDPDRDSFTWRRAPDSSLIAWWWGTSLISFVFWPVFSHLGRVDNPLLSTAGYAAAFPAIAASVTASLLALLVVRQLHQRQEEKAARGAPGAAKPFVMGPNEE